MKNLLKKIVLLSTLVLVAVSAFAQSQYEAMKNIVYEKPYNVYDVSGKPGNYEVSSRPMSMRMYFFLENEDDKRRLQIQRNFGGRRKFSVDEIGHPVTFKLGGLIKLPNLKYIRSTQDDVRMIVIGETIYFLNDYKGPSNYRLEYVVTKGKVKGKKGKKKSFRAMLKDAKSEIKGVSTAPQVGHEKIITDYLKKELAIQKVAAPKWKAANKDYYTQIEKDQIEWNRQKGVEYKKLNKFAWVENNSSYIIWFTTGNGSPIKVKVGELKRLPCDLAPMYRSDFQGKKGSLLFKPSQYCGKTFTVTQW